MVPPSVSSPGKQPSSLCGGASEAGHEAGGCGGVAGPVEGLILTPGLRVGRFGVDREAPNMLHDSGEYPLPAKLRDF